MNFRVLWEVLGRQRWFASARLRTVRRGPFRGRPCPSLPLAPERNTSRALLLSLTGVYNASKLWDKCDIEDTKLIELGKEMMELENLKAATVICKTCHKRLLIDKPISNKKYCECENNKAVDDESSGWQPFLETEDIIIWRRQEDPANGLYAYKVYGRYPEVTAEDFLAMHTDLTYWRSWDDTALSLRTLPQPENKHAHQDVIHWETMWPRFFANRDYVYVRRYAYMDSDHSNDSSFDVAGLQNCTLTQLDNKKITANSDDSYTAKNVHDDIKNLDKISPTNPLKNSQNLTERSQKHNNDNLMKIMEFSKRKAQLSRVETKNKRQKPAKVIVMTSQSCNHPDAPETKRAHRVKRYWSNLVIKPFTDTDQPGIEFSLTYFDDPGTSLPTALQSWVAGHACPDFLDKMRHAAANYRHPPHKKPSVETVDVKNIQDKPEQEHSASKTHTSMPQTHIDTSLVLSTKKNTMQSADFRVEESPKPHHQKMNNAVHTTETPAAKKEASTKSKNHKDTEDFLNLLYGHTTDLNTSKSSEEIAEVIEEKQEEIVKEKPVEEVALEKDRVKVESVKDDGSVQEDGRNREKCTKFVDESSFMKSAILGKSSMHDMQTQPHELQPKEVTQSSMSYWRVWPLYYFA